MNERVMQFRIGMFVIVAGLVLTMLIVWFGESPSLLRQQSYVIARYDEAPGVAEGIHVRKSGIRVGEVTTVTFDERPKAPDGVLVTIALDPKYHIKEGSVPRVSRSLIGDVSIDLMPGTGPGLLKTSRSPATAPVIEGSLAPDPSKALAAATKAFEKVGDTLASIDEAANGIAKVTKNAEGINEFLTTWTATGLRVRAAADGIDRFIAANENDFKPALANFREVATKLNDTLDPATQDAFKSGVSRFASATAQLDTGLTNASALFKDLGAPVNSTPKTDFGQAVRRVNLITSDFSLLTQTLRRPNGTLNTDGSLQKLLTSSDLHDNLNHFATSGSTAFDGFRPIIAALRVFADKIARDPSIIARGALQK